MTQPSQGPTIAVDAFLARYKNANTRELHRYNAGGYATWLENQGLDLRSAGEAEIRRYLDAMRNGRKVSTLNAIFKSIRAYYKWAYETGAIPHNPAANIPTFAPRTETPKFLSVDDIRRILRAARSDRDRAFIAILACSSIQQSELRACDVSDFEHSHDRSVLHLRFMRNSERRRQSYTVLAPEIVRLVQSQLEGRKQGPLFVSRFGERLSKSSGLNIVAINAKRAGVGFHVSPQMLTHSLPAIALHQGFSYRSVVRAIGIPDRRHSERWLATAGRPTEDNASVRLAHLVTSDPESTEFLFMQAEALLTDTDLPEPFAVAAVGAITERHLRALAESHRIPPVNDETKGLTYYAGELQRRGVLTVTDGRRFRALADQRNDAAHGWFDRISPGTGFMALREARSLVDRYPLAVSESDAGGEST